MLAVVALGVTGILSACGAGYTPGGAAPSAKPALLQPDEGWVSAGGAEFQPVPFKHPATLRPGGSTLVGTTGSEARVKWVADRAEVTGPHDARSALVVHVVDVTDPTDRADVAFRGAGGSGSADLPIEAGKRTVFRLTWTAVGTYRRCSVLIEVRTQ
jgi:hypothetical protein